MITIEATTTAKAIHTSNRRRRRLQRSTSAACIPSSCRATASRHIEDSRADRHASPSTESSRSLSRPFSMSERGSRPRRLASLAITSRQCGGSTLPHGITSICSDGDLGGCDCYPGDRRMPIAPDGTTLAAAARLGPGDRRQRCCSRCGVLDRRHNGRSPRSSSDISGTSPCSSSRASSPRAGSRRSRRCVSAWPQNSGSSLCESGETRCQIGDHVSKATETFCVHQVSWEIAEARASSRPLSTKSSTGLGPSCTMPPISASCRALVSNRSP